MSEIELITYLLILIGVSYTSFKIGITQGIQDAIWYFEEEGVIEFDKED